jgi:hypothetical protein
VHGVFVVVWSRCMASKLATVYFSIYERAFKEAVGRNWFVTVQEILDGLLTALTAIALNYQIRNIVAIDHVE